LPVGACGVNGTANVKLKGISEGLIIDELGVGETDVPVGAGELLGLENKTIPTIETARTAPIILIDLLTVISPFY